ncbi:terminase ATPase subunit family protein [Xanthomonas translucens]|uniref:terminase ATPase subunit family protein n=1 Tax=Xanthomonas campestris pv. translucens TaxID=343 RepID=UPI0021B7ECC0|nr:terminase ATPase subunit family protein [Xanthomonas translucens]MCT8273343.1 terminase ATPase subunit family protein [Xanthomonas translucens pv. translucens]MCT8277513.1 terminase ATPase subunit family protein [Xanthomonas translucens pv. translucens]MCT8306294.1 terminase ATPase subunit family protein [Xanthomonas translucens pv. translucens]WNJ27800.1 terminase ATPase subunit family protein [Xanthomonas translucens pv. translucens]
MNSVADKLPVDPRRQAKFLYWMGWRVCEIAEATGEKEKTIHSWKARDEWDRADNIERIGGALEARLTILIMKLEKTGGDFKEIDLLHRQLERQARIQRYQGGGNEADLNPNVANRNAVPRKPQRRNDFSEEQVEQLIEAFKDGCFDYQLDWYRARNQRTRAILKSRQIGATFYFAREALIDALTTGQNQIFLSASKAQAHIFRGYMQAFVRDVLGERLTGGDNIVLANGAEIFFLGTNARTAQGYHGNFYFDEFFWTYGFNELNKVASGMAMQKKYRKTYFSTPSSMGHEAYPFWTGERRNRGRPASERIKLDVTYDALARGRACEDRVWRQIVTIMDAARRGCDLFDVEELREEYSAEAFANLLMCEFVDDGASVFPLAMLEPCMVDSWIAWGADYKPFAQRPYGDRAVWIGYDPAETGDTAGLVVVAPPLVDGGNFRVLERHQFRGMDFAAQAEFIRKITLRYWVTYIGIDTTGMGTGVAQLVKQFFPQVTTFSYSPEVKTRLVLKAFDVIHNTRLEFDAGWTDLAQALMSIRKTMTASGRHSTYTAGRSEETGHGDLAWALFHALQNEPLEGRSVANGATMEIC